MTKLNVFSILIFFSILYSSHAQEKKTKFYVIDARGNTNYGKLLEEEGDTLILHLDSGRRKFTKGKYQKVVSPAPKRYSDYAKADAQTKVSMASQLIKGNRLKGWGGRIMGHKAQALLKLSKKEEAFSAFKEAVDLAIREGHGYEAKLLNDYMQLTYELNKNVEQILTAIPDHPSTMVYKKLLEGLKLSKSGKSDDAIIAFMGVVVYGTDTGAGQGAVREIVKLLEKKGDGRAKSFKSLLRK